ncbi:ABC transporter transmembrane domain-containing protein [Nocardia australiensis]|uniref:ABC transporter transmembrane domain-containing protein n=1 Tax=Nocardia australiensis TaxID=2887191 RepID=UPI001D1541B2|nr:ABC transporter transmembrane domain-containing protein [Nocardia australiensis]
MLRYRSDPSGFRVGTTLLQGMYHRLGDHLARLPLGWYSAGRIGEVSVLASRGVLQAMSAIAHLLSPYISACVTPLTIVAVMLAFNWQLGVAALAAVPIVAAVQIQAGRSTAVADEERHDREHEAAARVIEYLQAQPVLRAGGRTVERFRLLDDSLRDLQRTSHRSTLRAFPTALGLTLTVQTVFTALLALGAYLALDGNIGAAEVLAILVLAARCADPLLSLSDLGGKLRATRSVLARLDGQPSTASVERLMAGRTVVMVAHRLRTVQRADRIVFLDGGRIVEQGTHDQLMLHGGRYAAFWDISMTPQSSEREDPTTARGFDFIP